MIDTNVINYGISKIQAAISTCYPKIEGISAQFVNYTVFKQILGNSMSFGIFLLSLILWIPVYKYGKGNPGFTSFNNYEEVGFILPTAILSFIALIAIMSSIGMFPNTILAIKYPEMFTIQMIIEVAK